MKLYDEEILKLYSNISKLKDTETCPRKSWVALNKDEIILKSEQGLELGAGKAIGVSGVAITFADDFGDSEVIVKGSELNVLQNNTDINYARFVVVKLNKNLISEDTTRLYSVIRKIDYFKYHMYPKGFSMRISSKAFKETVRVSKEALDEGISLRRVGNLLLNEYLQIDGVISAKIIFAADTSNTEIFMNIQDIAKRCETITESLNTIYDGLVMDCNTCLQKSLCDEIDGIRELHMNSIGKMPIEAGLSI